MAEQPRITITRIPNMNILVIKQKFGNFFISTRDSIVIDVPGLLFIIKFLVMNNILSVKALEAIVEDYRDANNSRK